MKAVASALMEDQFLAGTGPELIQKSPKPVQGDPQDVFRVIAAGVIAPEKLYDFFLRNRCAPVADQVCQQIPDLSGTAVGIGNFLFPITKGKGSQHLNADLFHRITLCLCG